MEWAVLSFSDGVPVRKREKSMSGMKEPDGVLVGGRFGDVAEGAMLLVAWSITRLEYSEKVCPQDAELSRCYEMDQF